MTNLEVTWVQVYGLQQLRSAEGYIESAHTSPPLAVHTAVVVSEAEVAEASELEAVVAELSELLLTGSISIVKVNISSSPDRTNLPIPFQLVFYVTTDHLNCNLTPPVRAGGGGGGRAVGAAGGAGGVCAAYPRTGAGQSAGALAFLVTLQMVKTVVVM